MDSFITAEFHKTVHFKMSRHYHDYHQIIFVTGGKASFKTSNGLLCSETGNLNIINHLTEHSIIESSDDYERFVLKINPSIHNLTDIYHRIHTLLFSISLTVNHTLNVKEHFDEFRKLFEELVKESENKEQFKDEMMSLLFSALLLKIYRFFPEIFETIDEKHFDLVGEIQREFEKFPERQYTLSKLAKKYQVSASTLSHCFKKITGTSVMNYLNYCRIDKAKQYLSSTDIPLGEIVDICGFTDFSNFSRNFKAANGTSPSVYRKNHNI